MWNVAPHRRNRGLRRERRSGVTRLSWSNEAQRHHVRAGWFPLRLSDLRRALVHECRDRSRGTATAVLLRGAELLVPKPGGVGDESVALRGPGNLTRGLGITGADNGLDCCRAEGRHLTFHRTRRHKSDLPTGQSKRIGITREIDRPSRYFLDGHGAVSKLPTNLSTTNG